MMRFMVFFTENIIGNQLCPKDRNNFFESGCFAGMAYRLNLADNRYLTKANYG